MVQITIGFQCSQTTAIHSHIWRELSFKGSVSYKAGGEAHTPPGPTRSEAVWWYIVTSEPPLRDQLLLL